MKHNKKASIKTIAVCLLGALIVAAGLVLVFNYLNGLLFAGFFLIGLGLFVILMVIIRHQLTAAAHFELDGMDITKDDELRRYMDGGSHRGRL